MLPDEQDPLRTAQNTHSIKKVMLLGGVARPRYDTQRMCYFDRKIGMWPFVRKVKLQQCNLFLFLIFLISCTNNAICSCNWNQHLGVAVIDLGGP